MAMSTSIDARTREQYLREDIREMEARLDEISHAASRLGSGLSRLRLIAEDLGALAEQTPAAVPPGRFVCTPRASENTVERLFLEVSAEDHAQIGRGGVWRAVVTDLNTGIRYELADADCDASSHCHCAAVVIGRRYAPAPEAR